MPEEVVSEQPVPVVFEAPAPAEPPQEAKPETSEPEVQSQEAKEEPKAEEQPRDEKGKFKSPVQDRIDELTRARREAEREAEFWRQRANPAKPEAVAERPTADKFASQEEYVEALVEWKAEQKVSEALKARDAETAKSAEQRARETKTQTFARRVEQAKTSISDFDAVVSAADVDVAQHVSEALIDSEKGAELLYHLAKNPDIVDKLNRMSQREADREIGRIEATLGQVSKPPVKTSKAPEPMRPAGRGAATSATADPSKMSHEEYRAWRRTQGARW